MLPDVLAVEQHLEVSVAVAGAVVGEDAADAEAEAGEVSAGHVEEALGGGAGLVGQDGGEGEPGVVVDGDVEELVACAATSASAVAVDAVDHTFAGLNQRVPFTQVCAHRLVEKLQSHPAECNRAKNSDNDREPQVRQRELLPGDKCAP